MKFFKFLMIQLQDLMILNSRRSTYKIDVLCIFKYLFDSIAPMQTDASKRLMRQLIILAEGVTLIATLN